MTLLISHKKKQTQAKTLARKHQKLSHEWHINKSITILINHTLFLLYHLVSTWLIHTHTHTRWVCLMFVYFSFFTTNMIQHLLIFLFWCHEEKKLISYCHTSHVFCECGWYAYIFFCCCFFLCLSLFLFVLKYNFYLSSYTRHVSCYMLVFWYFYLYFGWNSEAYL